MNRLSAILDDGEITDLRSLHSFMRRMERGSIFDRSESAREWERYFLVLDKLVGGIGPKLETEVCHEKQKLQPQCSHKFIDSNHCLKCGWVPPNY